MPKPTFGRNRVGFRVGIGLADSWSLLSRFSRAWADSPGQPGGIGLADGAQLAEARCLLRVFRLLFCCVIGPLICP